MSSSHVTQQPRRRPVGEALGERPARSTVPLAWAGIIGPVVGTIPREVALLSELGLPPSTALAAASTSARKFLGFPYIRDGGADLVTYDDDPRDDPEVLARPAAVFLAGTRLR